MVTRRLRFKGRSSWYILACGHAMSDRLDIEIDPYVPRLAETYGTQAFVAPRPSNAVAKATAEYEQLAPLMRGRPCLMMHPGPLSGLDDDRSKCQRAHRGVAIWNERALRKRVSRSAVLAGGTFSMMAIVAICPVLIATFLAFQMVDPLVGVPTATRIAYHLLTILVHAARRSSTSSPIFALTRLRFVVLRHFHFPHNFPV